MEFLSDFFNLENQIESLWNLFNLFDAFFGINKESNSIKSFFGNCPDKFEKNCFSPCKSVILSPIP